jgi:hypothetical protein
MASFTFFPSIPRSFEVRELLRVIDGLKPEPDETPWAKVERSVVALMERNSQIDRQNIYGLTAVALLQANLLHLARSTVCTLRERLDDGGYEVLSNNHRFFAGPQGPVDPLVAFFKKQAKVVECHRPFRIGDYPVSTAKAVMEQMRRHDEDKQRRTSDDKQMWFDNTLHRLARRFQCPPDLYGSHPGSSDSAISSKYRRTRKKLEGVFRNFTLRMAEESEEHWKFYLERALAKQFPPMDETQRAGFIARIQDEHGPPLPRLIYRQRKKVKMVEPEIGGAGSWSH